MDFLNKLSKEQRDIADKVMAAARKYGVPENIALGMAMQESTFDQSKDSGVGPRGVMGLGIRASKDLKVDPKNVDQNIDGGMRYFKQQLDRTGNIDDALVAYHDGPSSAYFKGGEMSPAAANHIQKVKGYAGMAKDTTTTTPQASTGDFEIPQAGEIQTIDFDTGAGADAAPYTGPRLRDTNDVAAGVVGTALGYGVGKVRQVSQKEQALELQAKALALREQNLEHEEARRQQNAQYQRDLDTYNETIRRQNAQYQMDLEDHARYMNELKANEAKQYGIGTENWKDQEYGEPIARQIEDPLSKSTASAEANAAIARHQKAKQLFPNQVPAAEGSLLSIPIVAGGQTQVPMQRNTRPAPAPAPQPPSKPIPPPMPSRPAPVAPPPLQVAPKPPGRLQTVGSSLLGGLAGTQLYNAYQNIFKEGKTLDGLISGTGGLSALLGTAVKSPKLKALSAVPASMSFVPELMDYFRSGEEVPAKAEGGMIHMAGGGLAPHGMRHSGEGAKGKGYFGMMPSQDIGEGPVDYSLATQPHSTEISLEDDDIGEYPSLVPGLTKEEMDHMLAGNAPTDSIIQKARMHAMMRQQKGMSPFAQPDELRHPVPHYGAGGVAKKGAQAVFTHLADRFPSLIPGVLKTDKNSGKQYLGKALSDEEKALQKARNAAQKDINAGNYQPFFDVSQRFHSNPANYPMSGNTLTDAMPKRTDTIANYKQQFDTPETIARLREAYGKAKGDPLAHNFYAMGQLEEAFIKELGPDMGRKMFRERFAEPMAATTGGADPTANLLSAYYANHMRQAGTPMGGAAHELPHPIGGRFIMGNLGQYDKIINQGAGLTTATPKRFNFSSNFMGHKDRSTMDEQMMGIFDPTLKHKAPPGDSYGVVEGVSNKAAGLEGVDPVNFQEVAWAGTKGQGGKPMIQHVNEAIERTSRVTGKSPEEVLVDSIIHARSPLYGGAAVGLGGLSQYEDQR